MVNANSVHKLQITNVSNQYNYNCIMINVEFQTFVHTTSLKQSVPLLKGN